MRLLRILKQSRVAHPSVGSVRNLNLHEYQSVQLLRKFGLGTPNGDVASTPEEAEKIASGIKGDIVIKAQVLAGGRGLGHFDNGMQGGVKIAQKAAEIKDFAAKMIGANLITKQTDSHGRPCSKVLIVEKIESKSEKYLAIMMDRESLGPIVVASAVGGVTIEDIAEKDPHFLIKEPVNIRVGMTDEAALKIAKRMRFSDAAATKEAASNISKLYKMFLETDATMVEINPFTETADGRIVAVDAKVNFDDNAAFRQKEIHAQRDFTQESADEVQAAKFDLNYVHLDGNIGCMVNGAGLAMATMDICSLYKGSPANFLDVGGGATEKQIYEAFKILTMSDQVKCILVNIFGGIMRCDTIAAGVISAAKNLNLKVPVVVRLQGTNVDKANEMLAASGLNLIRASNLDDAAEKAVAAASANK